MDDPHMPDAALYESKDRAYSLLESGDREQAEKHMHQLLESIPGDFDDDNFYDEVAKFFFKLENYPEAEKYYEKALKTFKPESYNYDYRDQLYEALGVCLHKQKKHGRALTFFQQAAAICTDPKIMPSLYFAQGCCYLGLKQYAEAEIYYRNAYKLNPNQKIRFHLAYALGNQGKFPQAEAFCLEALEIDSEDGNFHLLLAVLNKRMGFLDQADEYITKAKKCRNDKPLLVGDFRAMLRNLELNILGTIVITNYTADDAPTGDSWLGSLGPGLE